MTRISRRDFVRLGTAVPLVLDPPRTHAATTTAQEIVDRIRKSLGVEWRADTVDTFTAGDPSTVVTGIVTTSLATVDVMRRAVKAGANMIITSGPTFYSRADRPMPPAGRGRGAAATPPADPVFVAKNEYIKTNNLVVWRFSDHWRLRTPNPFTTGLIDALEWTRYRATDNPLTVTVPSITLERLVEDVSRRLNARGGMRVVGSQPWNDRDDVTIVSGDPLSREKLDFLTKNNVVIFRMHDHMHDQRPDFLYVGSARELGLDATYESAPGSHRFTIPATTLGRLAADVKKRVGARALRVVGDPNARVSRIQLGVGYATPSVNDPAVDVVISGEQQEVDGGFDNPEYVLDAAALGIPKGWIMLGHAVSEEAGMLEMAQWIGRFVTEVPVRLIKAGEPFWAPQ